MRLEGEGERHQINGALGIKFQRHVGSSDEMCHDSSLEHLCLQLRLHTTRRLTYHLAPCNSCVCVCLFVCATLLNRQQHQEDYVLIVFPFYDCVCACVLLRVCACVYEGLCV